MYLYVVHDPDFTCLPSLA